MPFFVRKLAWQRWVPAFDSAVVPELLQSFLIDRKGVSLWEYDNPNNLGPVIANIAARFATRSTVIHIAQVGELAIAQAHLRLLDKADWDAPVESLRASHREIFVATAEEANRFVAAVREAPRKDVSWAQAEAAIVDLFDSGELRRERCGSAAVGVLDRLRPA